MLLSLEYELRYRNPDEVFDEYYSYLLKLSLPKRRINEGERFFRARKGCLNLPGAIDDFNTEIEYPFYGSDLQAPPPIVAGGGRFNRDGTSFLYLASSVETCVAEIHLEVNQICSVANFECVVAGDYLNLTPNEIGNTKDENDLYHILTQPIHHEIIYRYKITQFLSDIFRRMGFQGIIYKSTQGDGENIVCYHPSDFNAVRYSERMYKATKIDYQIVPVPEGYKQYSDYRKLLNPYNSEEEERRQNHFEYIEKRIEYDDKTEFEKMKKEVGEIENTVEKQHKLDQIVNKFINVPSCRLSALFLRGDYKLKIGKIHDGLMDYIYAFSWRRIRTHDIDKIVEHIITSKLMPESTEMEIKEKIKLVCGEFEELEERRNAHWLT